MREGVATQQELDEIKDAVLASYEKDFEVCHACCDTYQYTGKLVLVLETYSAVQHRVSTAVQ